jgi:glycosyltransferase involved in cell wall biosynthesis
MNFSIVIPIYNEEKRICKLLSSIRDLSDDIVVINKSSDDDSKAIIKNLEIDAVSVIDTAFKPKGDDDFSLYASYAKHDWIFVMVASETAPEHFKSHLQGELAKLNLESIDILMVPRLYYCFGSNVLNSPWDVAHFPFFFHRKRAIINNVPHQHVVPSCEARRMYLSFPRTMMIKHETHTSIERFMESVISYGALETAQEDLFASIAGIEKSLRNIQLGRVKLKNSVGVDAAMHFAAWNIHWSYQLLKRCQRIRCALEDSTGISRIDRVGLNSLRFLRIQIKQTALMYLRFLLLPLVIRYNIRRRVSSVLNLFFAILRGAK